MLEQKEIEVVSSLMHRSRTLAFDDFDGLQKLQDDRDEAIAKGLVNEEVKYTLLLVFLERVQNGEADEVARRLYPEAFKDR